MMLGEGLGEGSGGWDEEVVMKPVIEKLGGQPPEYETWYFWCERCGSHHYFRTKAPEGGGGVWQWNGDTLKPTVTPSIKVVLSDGAGCHLFLVDGVAKHTDGQEFRLRALQDV